MHRANLNWVEWAKPCFGIMDLAVLQHDTIALPLQCSGQTWTVGLHYRRCKCVSWNRVGYLSPNPSKRSTPI